MEWYQRDIKEIFVILGASEKGLSDAEVRERLEKHGPNKLVEEEKTSKLKILLHQFTSPLIYILLIAAVVTALLKEYTDMGVILVVVVLNAVIGYVQEYKAEESVRSLKRMVVAKARVLRDEREREVNSEDLVPGDIVLLASGVRVPADIRLLKTNELRIDEAMLTGESLPAEKSYTPIKEANLTPGDQKNMTFMGTAVVNGRARGVVVETGDRTILGRIAKDVREVSVLKTPLQERLDRLARLIGLVVVLFSLLVFGIGVMLGQSVSEMFLIAVAMAVSAIPEGLPIAVTIAMALGVSKMSKRNAIIRKLPAVETLGSITVIGSDKTGTLTKNEMTVKRIYDGEQSYEVDGSGYKPEGRVLREGKSFEIKEREMLLLALRIGLLCNESDVYTEEEQYKVDGDPTEGALIVAAMKAGLDPELERKGYPQIDIIPFESERGYMATLHRHDGRKSIFVKGAPEKLVSLCTECGIAKRKEEILQAADHLAQEGLRVLAMAYKEVAMDKDKLVHEDLESELVFAGLQGMMDPPRPEAKGAVEGCRRAGIRTAMITGDNAVTAQAIAKSLGIGGEKAEVLNGRELEVMSDEELFNKVKEISVYARVAPQHKLRITQQLLKQGEVVAVTGDGVNDAPALKAAHIGVAMGLTGTDVAKEASDMVLADDNFASIFAAVEEGRIVYDNIKKVTFFLVSCGLGELIAILTTVITGYPIPFIPAQILWLNLVTNGLQDVALAFEPGEKGVLDRPPRHPKEGIISKLMMQRILLTGIILAAGTLYMFITDVVSEVPLERARTVALTTMVFFQFYQAFNSRSETQSIFSTNPLSNPLLFFGIIAAFLAHLTVLYVPQLQWIFRTVPLSLSEWLEIGLVTVSVLAAVEIDKAVRRRYAVQHKHESI